MQQRYVFLLLGILLLLRLTGHAQQKTVYYPLPDTTRFVGNDFTFLDPVTPLLAYKGGLLLPELGCWLVQPAENSIMLNAVTDAAGHLYTLALNEYGVLLEKRTIRRDSSVNIQCLQVFNNGFYTFFQSRRNGHIYLFVSNRSGSSVYRLNTNDQLETVLTLPGEKISAMYCEDDNQGLVATGRTVWHYAGNVHTRLMEMPGAIEGISMTENSGLIVSLSNGTIMIRPAHQPEYISRKVHGPLHRYGRFLYILSLEQNALVRIPLMP